MALVALPLPDCVVVLECLLVRLYELLGVPLEEVIDISLLQIIDFILQYFFVLTIQQI